MPTVAKRSRARGAATSTAAATAAAKPAAKAPAFRPPAVPLVTHDPYLSTWSFTDHLADGWASHWTGARRPMSGLLRIDRKPFRFLGQFRGTTPAMKQLGVTVDATTTTYRFAGGGVELTVQWVSPLLCDDLDLLARPVTYVEFAAKSTDGKPHAVELHLDITTEYALDSDTQLVTWSRARVGDLEALSAGSVDQRVLARSGDNLRCDWGYVYLVAPRGGLTGSYMGPGDAPRDRFLAGEGAPEADDLDRPALQSRAWPVLAVQMDFGKVGALAVERHAMIAYDDLFCMEHMHRKVRAYWRRNRMSFAELLQRAEAERPQILARCAAFDAHLRNELIAVGGEKYADLCALAYRQGIAAHKLAVDFDGSPLFFSKENFSNGCINTVDVTYPSAPFFVHFAPALLKAQIQPILDYACSPRWKFEYAPHDLGTYPLANGQVYGGAEDTDDSQMPVEECGNMLICAAAYVKASGDTEFAAKYWSKLSQWAGYLQKKGLDPENQLCTDDFAGHLGHNCNLSIKAIVGLGAYAKLAETLGRKQESSEYFAIARGMAARWIKMADDGDHFRLAFDRAGSWSQKYNLVWDELLGLKLFPPAVARKEIAFYLKQNTKFGLPLDSRSTYTKLDWILWTATMAESEQDFRALMEPVYAWAQATPDRVPLGDWYETAGEGKHIHFRARSVVAGVFIKLLKHGGRLKGKR
ncbi:MAG: glutaminase domain-containing protein [Planctomycetota bacterium]